MKSGREIYRFGENVYNDDQNAARSFTLKDFYMLNLDISLRTFSRRVLRAWLPWNHLTERCKRRESSEKGTVKHKGTRT